MQEDGLGTEYHGDGRVLDDSSISVAVSGGGMTKTIFIKNFSFDPSGRFYSDGPHSGQQFREELLVPALKEYERVIVDLDGTLGIGSSFLEEAFGGLVRLEGFSAKKLEIQLSIVGGEASDRAIAWEKIREASKKGR